MQHLINFIFNIPLSFLPVYEGLTQVDKLTGFSVLSLVGIGGLITLFTIKVFRLFI